jgi:hypothetical protein
MQEEVQRVIRGHKQQNCRNNRGKAVGLKPSLLGLGYWILDGLNRIQVVGYGLVMEQVHGFGSSRLSLDRLMNQKVQI